MTIIAAKMTLSKRSKYFSVPEVRPLTKLTSISSRLKQSILRLNKK